MHVAAFYAFVPIPAPRRVVADLRQRLGAAEVNDASVRGTVLVASEGINATLSGPREKLERAVASAALLVNTKLQVNWSRARQHPFRRLRLRVRPEIVTFGQPDAEPTARTAPHVDARTWDELLARDDVLVLDVRNDYEIHAGRFRGGISPDTADFTEFARYVDEALAGREQQKIAMYCTGGIRCEKASSLLLAKGFQDVVQLDGGVLGYFSAGGAAAGASAAPSRALWEGECFVFDERATVKQDLEPGDAVLCGGCGWPVTAQQQELEAFAEERRCPRCVQERAGC